MNLNVGDILQCEKQLREALHSDDKEKLRRKLALLKREYVKTAQRLQRAERLEAVRKHVRSRISEQNRLDHRDSEVASTSRVNSSSLILNSTNAEDQGAAQAQEHPPDSDPSRRSQVIRFILPSESSPQPPDSCHDSGRGHRPSSALRLRSRRSRLRWERRSAEADQSLGINLKGLEQSEGIQVAISAEEEEPGKWRGSDTVKESEEKLSGSDSDSPSLLLTHWSSHKKAENGDEEKTENCRHQEESDNKTDVVREGPCDYLLSIEEGKLSAENKEEEDVRKDEEEKRTCKEEENKKAEQTETVENENRYTEKSQTSGDEKSLLDSCTLVEGLLFPVEYYVRTTRRMTSSQSQPDIQAVLLSQLSVGRQRRSRGRGGRTSSISERRTPSSPAASSPPPSSLNPPVVQPGSASAGKGLMAGLPPTVKTACPPRGRKKRRGRGRGRPQTPKHSFKYQNPQVVVTPDNVTPSSSLSQSLSSSEGPNPIFNTPQDVKEVDLSRPVSGSITASQTPSGVAAVQSGSVSALVEQVYPIFMKHSLKTNKPQQTVRGPSDCTSLLLPPTSSPVQPPLLSLPPPSLFSLVGSLKSVDIHQDFHLPDEHFASLKLHKLRQVAVESGVEHFSTPSRNTRSSLRRCDVSDSWTAVPLVLTSMPTAADLPLSEQKHKAADLLSGLPLWSEKLTETLSSSSFTKEQTDVVESVEKVHAGTPNSSTESQEMSVEPETNATQVNIQCSLSAGNVLRSSISVQMVSHPKTSDQQTRREQVSSKEQADGCGEDGAVEDQRSVAPEEESRADLQISDWCGKESPEELCNTSACSQDDGKAEAVVKVQNAQDPLDSKEPSVCEEKRPENKPMCASQLPDLLLTSHVPSAPCPFLSPHLPSSLLSSPALPSLGLTPHPAAGSLPLTLPPSAPSLSLPPPHSPSAWSLPPPALSPCPSFTVESAARPPLTSAQRHSAWSPTPTEKPAMRRTHTLKAATGGLLVDACCFHRASWDLCVAAAGKWAVCLWSQTSASDWSLKHTWTFSEPVINVFPVPDAAGLICVTLGQLEIREVRVLSCSSLMQRLICEGVIQVVVGVSKSRVVTSSCSTMGSTLQVYALSDSSRSQRCQPMVSPDVCVSALAPVDGLPDALIATDEHGRLFIWNTKSGQLLCKVQLEQSLSHTACLRGYSVSGALLVLLQHQHLSLPQEEDKTKLREATSSEEPEVALFSLVAINPHTARSVLVTRLTPPSAWRSRLFEADVNQSCVAALSPSGGVCVWELGRGGGPQILKAPDGEDWQLARWGEEDTLVIGHQNGDVSLYCCSTYPTSSCL